jgi:hypothetical protein
VAAIFMAAAIAGLKVLFGPTENLDRWSAVVQTAVCLSCGVLAFVMAGAALGVSEIRAATDAFLSPLKRLLTSSHAKIRV